MTHKRLPLEDYREWLNRARSNLVQARAVMPGVYFEDLCFEAQQAAEKAIKAVFVYRAESFPYTHNISRLLKQLERDGIRVPKYVYRAVGLSRFAVETRYPGLSGPVSNRQYQSAVRIAAAVLQWAERQTKG